MDRFKVGDVVVKVREIGLEEKELGFTATIIKCDGDGMPRTNPEHETTPYISDVNYELHAVMESPLYKALE